MASWSISYDLDTDKVEAAKKKNRAIYDEVNGILKAQGFGARTLHNVWTAKDITDSEPDARKLFDNCCAALRAAKLTDFFTGIAFFKRIHKRDAP